MVRIIHTADIHLDSPLQSLALRNESLREVVEAATRTAFQTITGTAIAEHADALLIAGDLFDGKQRSARTAVFLIEQLDRLRQAGVRVFYIKGNHDAENQLTGSLDLPDNVHVFSGRGGKVQLTGDIWVHGVSFSERHAPVSLLPRFSAPVAGAVNIALLHTSLSGAQGHDVYAPCAVSDLITMGFDYWALGHVHKRQIHSEDPWVVMPGMPQGRDIGEAGPKSASLLTITDKTIDVTEVQTCAVEFISDSLDISNTDTDDALRNQLRVHLRTIAGQLNASAGVLRLELQGTPNRHWQFLRDNDYWREQVSELARETDCLWIDKLKFNLEAPVAQDTSASAIDELAVIIAQIQSEPGFANTAEARVSEVIQDLPTEVRARMLPDENSTRSLAQTLCQSGSKQILARMKGADS
ncbi:metallophosphoesterase [Chromatiales bacterium (ex Bugula neritina AB1)]|nr:metallophosphoesterase [Chromatiales bacterium (ex Bugula neritina AB1)]